MAPRFSGQKHRLTKNKENIMAKIGNLALKWNINDQILHTRGTH